MKLTDFNITRGAQLRNEFAHTRSYRIADNGRSATIHGIRRRHRRIRGFVRPEPQGTAHCLCHIETGHNKSCTQTTLRTAASAFEVAEHNSNWESRS